MVPAGAATADKHLARSEMGTDDDEGVHAREPARGVAQDSEDGPPQAQFGGDAVSAEDVLVHGLGTEDVLDVLDEIAEATAHRGPVRASRKLEDAAEFEALAARVRDGSARVRLRKLFLCQQSCSVMQEIWIADPRNPDAARDPLKSYSIVHVHHHASVASVGGITPADLALVDAINVRHLAEEGRGYQGDNPFFRTFIEPSGRDTLKVFPRGKWECRKCGRKHVQAKGYCGAGSAGAPCAGARPCTMWKWKVDDQREKDLAQILASANAVLPWPSKSGKSMHRASDSAGDLRPECSTGLGLAQLKQEYEQRRAKVCGSCCKRVCICAGVNIEAPMSPGPPIDAAATRPGLDAEESETGWDEKPSPEVPPPPHRILFIGANNSDSSPQVCQKPIAPHQNPVQIMK